MEKVKIGCSEMKLQFMTIKIHKLRNFQNKNKNYFNHNNSPKLFIILNLNLQNSSTLKSKINEKEKKV